MTLGIPFRLWMATVMLATFVGVAFGQERPPISPEDYERWETLGRGTLSPDGQWLVYAIRRVNEDYELRLRDLRRDTTRVLPYASDPVFTVDSRFLAYSIGVAPEERRRLEEEAQEVRNRVGILDLVTGGETVVESAASFAPSPDGAYLAVRAYPREGSDTKAADLLLRDLRTRTVSNFGNVSEFAWADEVSLLAMAIETESGTANGVQLYDPRSGTLRALESSDRTYRNLAWREDADDLVVLRSVEREGYEGETHRILAWTGLTSDNPEHYAFDPMAAEGFLPDVRIVEHRTPEWARDGSAIYFGLRPWERVASPPDSSSVDSTETEAEDDPQSNVQIWHARDVRIIPMQRAQEERDLRRYLLAVWHPSSDRFVQLGTDLMETVAVLEGGQYATETSDQPYEPETMFGRQYRDVYLMDTRTGARTKVLDRVRHFFGGSATGRYLLYFRGEHFWTYDTRTGEHANRTAATPASFANADYDHPVTQLPPHGVAGWLTDDVGILVYDKYDVWRLSLDGSEAVRLTRGAEEQVVHRYVRLDSEERSIDLEQPVYWSLFGERSKQSGYERSEGHGEPRRLLLEDKRVTRLARADSTPVFTFTMEGFDDSPDYFVGDDRLRRRRQASETNPFQENFAWGRSELVDFESATGKQLQAALLYPANYEPGRQYPMIVYTYEILSPRVHAYVVPSARSYYNFAVFSSQGYFVLLPDIVYRPRDPGRSAVEAVVPAVQAIVARGLVDPERIGLVGHSWGGYQATYIPTQTDVFAASVAGAPLTNFLSMMGAIHWNPGLPETSHWETGQARMDVPYWEDFAAHVRNSPAAFIQDLTTPMLMMFGDDDGVVDWHQGIEFYNFARRAGKEFVLLVYPGEDHSLRKEENQRDYQRRILEWFGHYLKGEPAAKWMTEGVPHLEQKREVAVQGRQ